jgi:malonate transporter and related proteins
MIETVLDGILPIAFVIALGWLSGRLKLLKHEDAGVFATLIIRFALPLALFLGAAKTTPDKLSNLGFAGCLVFGLMGTFILALFVGHRVFKHDLRTSTMQALVCAFPDMAYFGAPILAAMFGPEGFLAVLVGNLITSILMLPLTIILTRVSGKQEAGHGWDDALHILGSSLLSALMSPIVWLPVTGMILSFSHVHLPEPILASVDQIAKSAGGVSLFALGLMLYGEPVRINADVLTNIGLKNFVQPALMLLGTFIFGVSGPLASQVVITGAVPTATAASMFALRNKTYTAEATSTILISTILGLITEAALIAYLKP